MSGFANQNGQVIVERMIEVIHENRAYLSEIDGAIGDGDHGINMDKGFTMVAAEIDGKNLSMSDALRTLGKTLVMDIGGSMGPLYGTMFRNMFRESKNEETIDASVFASMLKSALDGVSELGEAKVGDKTLVDTLAPAAEAAGTAAEQGLGLPESVDRVIAAARAGWESTKDLVSKVGRSARLGERSKGVLDAGATSCFLLLEAMGNSMKELCT